MQNFKYKILLFLKVEFIIELKEKLMKVKHELITKELINSMIMDIRKYLVNREEYETN